MVAPDHHRPSFDITSIELQHSPSPPSPAPSYRSTIHTGKDYSSFSTSPSTFTWEDRKPYKLSTKSGHHNILHDEKTGHTTHDTENGHSDFELKEEPHDTNHPHYAPPSSPTHYEPPQKPPPRRRRFPRLHPLLPWVLALIFFLITLWFASIALGARFLNVLHPPTSPQLPPSINVVINENGNQPGGTPVVSIGTQISPATSAPKSSATETGTGNDRQDVGRPIADLDTSRTPTPSTLIAVTTSRA
ncbi:hypothetical protein BU26DRAFT_35450 [Trematosphaeria pertusa]|uniref:Uncharacterized protein n=1 Tax=Trematosphaeria pertusa TaxID=390896 RepID=A0A6A6J3B1_9PLEO|nr:uncharacterized protein BU26DRAFT_35450 [Trematosphaeria pertusa]KAF2257058.1 hypothetical protein BU26DRAFT_35450 [Trematosphaeria pertusa]